MAQQSPPSPQDNSRQLFSEIEDPSVLSTQFWARLFRYRPLLLLGAFWLTLICVSAVAYSRLMFSGVPVTSSNSGDGPIQRPAPPPVIQAAPPGSISSEALDQRLKAPPLDNTLSPEEADAAQAAGPFPWSSLWGLLSLVGLCGLGSFLIAYQAKRPPRPKQRRKVPPQAAVKRKPGPPKPTRPKRLSPYSPDRDRVVIPGTPMAMEQPPRSTAPPLPSMPNLTPTPQQQSPMATAAASPHEPDIVPDHEDHPLDWSEESIAHSLDLRQRRSLSSFM